jgi:hypothetical protein
LNHFNADLGIPRDSISHHHALAANHRRGEFVPA